MPCCAVPVLCRQVKEGAAAERGERRGAELWSCHERPARRLPPALLSRAEPSEAAAEVSARCSRRPLGGPGGDGRGKGPPRLPSPLPPPQREAEPKGAGKLLG